MTTLYTPTSASSAHPAPSAETAPYLGPNWFASVMGTGIVATAGATIPFRVPGLHLFTLGVWEVATVLLLVLSVAFVAHWIAQPRAARRYHLDPTLIQFYGAPPMAFLTVGAGALLVGRSVLGTSLAVSLDWVLWSLGTLTGLVSAVAVPFRLFTSLEVRADSAFGGWLMPIVPPMVSAATGALLISHLGSPGARALLFYSCYAMFGLSLIVSFIVITLIWSRLAHFGSSGTVRVPTLWIVLGPLGQSVTALGLLGANATLAVAPPFARGFAFLSVAAGVPIWGFAVLWIALALALTLRTARRRLPFHLTWWSFTFPVGTFVTGTTRLALASHLYAFHVAAGISYLGLLGAWLLVATQTTRHLVARRLLATPVVVSPGPEARKNVAA